jgi:F0F1-type ATP synthase assembly protein I
MHPLRDLGRYGTVGIELLVSMALGYYGGRWLDARVDGHGWVTGIGSFLGVFVGFYSIWKASQTMARDVERAEKAEEDEQKRKRGEEP